MAYAHSTLAAEKSRVEEERKGPGGGKTRPKKNHFMYVSHLKRMCHICVTYVSHMCHIFIMCVCVCVSQMYHNMYHICVSDCFPGWGFIWGGGSSRYSSVAIFNGTIRLQSRHLWDQLGEGVEFRRGVQT